jgi:hypothetical protein
MKILKNPPSIRDLMPDNYTVQLSALTKCKNVSNLSQIVRLEHTKSKYWPAVEALAEKTNPTGFAAWKATQAEPAQTA